MPSATVATEVGWSVTRPTLGTQTFRNHTVASGGSTSSADAGWPDHSPSTAVIRAEVADPGPAVVAGVGVDDLVPVARRCGSPSR